MLSKSSLRISAQGIAVVHNLMLGAFTAVGGGTDMIINGVNQPRYTPYHIPHRTEVAGFMTILHGDDRIYNNIFIQKCPVAEMEEKEDMGFTMTTNQVVGTEVFDEYPVYEEWLAQFAMDRPANLMELSPYHYSHLPVWVNGNAYFNGAKPCKNEKSFFEADPGKTVFAEVEEKEGKYYFRTNVGEFLKDFRDDIISTQTRGKAFEPEQKFENPDGTELILDRDYFGEHRGLKTIPGPFAKQDSYEKIKKSALEG